MNPFKKQSWRAKQDKAKSADPDMGILAEAVHEAVCEVYGEGGFRGCLLYAILGCDWLNRHSAKHTHALAGGKFLIEQEIDAIKGSNGAFEHFWIVQGRQRGSLPKSDPAQWTLIDFATRHTSRTMIEGLRKMGSPESDLVKAETSLRVLDLPYYIGPHGSRYFIEREPSVFAQREYELAARTNTKVVDKFYESLILNPKKKGQP